MGLQANALTFFQVIEQCRQIDQTPSGNNNCKIIGEEGNDYIESVGNYNEIDGGEDDDSILSMGDHNNILGSVGNNTMLISGNYNNISADNGNNKVELYGSSNTTVLGHGNNFFELNGYKNTSTLGNGKNNISIIGDANVLSVGNGNNNLGLWGNNFTGKFGNGNNIINTLDWAFKNNYYTSLAEYFASNFVTYWINEETNETGGTISGLSNILLEIGSGSNKINLTISDGLELNTKEKENRRNEIVVNGDYDI